MPKKFKQKLNRKNWKNGCIFKDKITCDFLASLKKRRLAMKLTQIEVSKRTGISKSLISCYERNKALPSLGKLLKLAEFYNVDISESINWKIINDHVSMVGIKKEIDSVGFTYKELAKEIYGVKNSIVNTLNKYEIGSIRVLGDISDVLERERKSKKFRDEILKKKKIEE